MLPNLTPRDIRDLSATVLVIASIALWALIILPAVQ